MLFSENPLSIEWFNNKIKPLVKSLKPGQTISVEQVRGSFTEFFNQQGIEQPPTYFETMYAIMHIAEMDDDTIAAIMAIFNPMRDITVEEASSNPAILEYLKEHKRRKGE